MLGVEGQHADLIVGREGRDAAGRRAAGDVGLVDATLRPVATTGDAAPPGTVAGRHRTARVDGQHLGDGLLPQRIADLRIDRQQRLQVGAPIAAEGVGPLAADHDEPAAEVTGGRRKGLDLGGCERTGIHVDEHDGLIPGQPLDAGQIGRGDLLGSDAGRPERGDDRVAFAISALGHQHDRRAGRLQGRVAGVVLGHGVAGRRHLDPVAGDSRRLCDLIDIDHVVARLQGEGPGVDRGLRAGPIVSQHPHRCRTGGGGPHDGSHGEALARPDPPGDLHRRHRRIGARRRNDRVHIDRDAFRREPLGLDGDVAVGEAAVGHEDHPTFRGGR